MYGIGVMSGTSVDSIDLAYVKISKTSRMESEKSVFSSLKEFSNQYKLMVETIATHEAKWPQNLKAQILELVLEKKPI